MPLGLLEFFFCFCFVFDQNLLNLVAKVSCIENTARIFSTEIQNNIQEIILFCNVFLAQHNWYVSDKELADLFNLHRHSLLSTMLVDAAKAGHDDVLTELLDNPHVIRCCGIGLLGIFSHVIYCALVAAVRCGQARCVATLLSLPLLKDMLDSVHTRTALATALNAAPICPAVVDAFIEHAPSSFGHVECEIAFSRCDDACFAAVESACPTFVFRVALKLLEQGRNARAEACIMRVLLNDKSVRSLCARYLEDAIVLSIKIRHRPLLAWLLMRPFACDAILRDAVLRTAVQTNSEDILRLVLADPRARPVAAVGISALGCATLTPRTFAVADILLADPRVVPIVGAAQWLTLPERYRAGHRIIPNNVITAAQFEKACELQAYDLQACDLQRALAVRAARKAAVDAGRGAAGTRHKIEARARLAEFVLRMNVEPLQGPLAVEPAPPVAT